GKNVLGPLNPRKYQHLATSTGTLEGLPGVTDSGFRGDRDTPSRRDSLLLPRPAGRWDRRPVSGPNGTSVYVPPLRLGPPGSTGVDLLKKRESIVTKRFVLSIRRHRGSLLTGTVVNEKRPVESGPRAVGF